MKVKVLVILVLLLCGRNALAEDEHAIYVSQENVIELFLSGSPELQGLTGGLYLISKDAQVLAQPLTGESFSATGHNRLEVKVLPLDPGKKYIVKLYPAVAGQRFIDLPVEKMLVVRLGQNNGCPNGVEISLDAADVTTHDASSAIDALYDWVSHFQPRAIVASGKVAEDDGTEHPVDLVYVGLYPSDRNRAKADGSVRLCLRGKQRMPIEDGRLSLTFAENPPEVLRLAVSGTYKGDKAIDFSESDKGVGERALEKNLDLQLSYTSSVSVDATTGVRKRDNNGTLDVRLAPWLNQLKVHYPVGNWLRYWTPVYIDAKVSTGPITTDTLSENRVVLGTEYEWRYIRDTAHNTMHRFTLHGQHLSDRDFKQLEFNAGIKYELMWDPLYHPLAMQQRLDPDAWFGWQITPSAGFDVGRTYERRNPAAAVIISDAVRRFSNALEIKLNFTKYVTVEVEDDYYVRGEAADVDLFHNHFKAEVDLPLARPLINSGQSLAISFERGNQPPFATPDVNAFKVSYKFSSTRWFGQVR